MSNIGEGKPTRLDVRSFVVMFDVVDFSMRGGSGQADCVERFFDLLKRSLGPLKDAPFHIFPTGDGAVVCTYEGSRDEQTRRNLAIAPLEIAKNVLRLRRTEKMDFELRVSINYSDKDRLIEIGDFASLDASQIQIGDGINLAERIIHFGDPQEIIMSQEYHDVLHDEESFIRSKGEFPQMNRYSVVVKHDEDQTIYSYSPREEEKDYIYGVSSIDAQIVKKYAYFPPIRSDIFQKVKRLNLLDELANLCAFAFDNLKAINERHMFVTLDSIYEVLPKIPVLQEKDRLGVRVILRDDRQSNFWADPAVEKYLSHLEYLKTFKRFKQTRVIVYDLNTKSGIPDGIMKRLFDLHSEGSLKRIPIFSLGNNPLFKYIFGVTIFPALDCAITPAPPSANYREYVDNELYNLPESVFNRYREIERFEKTFKARVIFDHEIVTALTAAFDSVMKDRTLENYVRTDTPPTDAKLS